MLHDPLTVIWRCVRLDDIKAQSGQTLAGNYRRQPLRERGVSKLWSTSVC